MMNSIFQKLLHKGVLENYMDNFVIPAKTIKELKEKMIQFLKITEKYNLCFKISKYDFNMEKIPILGVVVGKKQDKSSQRMEDTNKNQESRELSGICKFL